MAKWVAAVLNASVIHALTFSNHPQAEKIGILMLAFSEVTSLKFLDSKAISDMKQVDYEYTRNEKVVVPVVDALRRGACRPSTEEEIDNQERIR